MLETLTMCMSTRRIPEGRSKCGLVVLHRANTLCFVVEQEFRTGLPVRRGFGPKQSPRRKNVKCWRLGELSRVCSSGEISGRRACIVSSSDVEV